MPGRHARIATKFHGASSVTHDHRISFPCKGREQSSAMISSRDESLSPRDNLFQTRLFCLFWCLLLVGLFGILPNQATYAQTSSSNPIIPGDHPDPTIIRVGDSYWTSSTSGDWAPNFSCIARPTFVTGLLPGQSLRLQPRRRALDICRSMGSGSTNRSCERSRVTGPLHADCWPKSGGSRKSADYRNSVEAIAEIRLSVRLLDLHSSRRAAPAACDPMQRLSAVHVATRPSVRAEPRPIRDSNARADSSERSSPPVQDILPPLCSSCCEMR